MNRITSTFAKNAQTGRKALIPFITGGDPDLETTEKLILAMSQAGADIIEIGIPFSDPVAEGPTIQGADERALSSGTTTAALLDMIKSVRAHTDTPLLFMTYLNPIYTYGKERFLSDCKSSGIDGIIVPDMPYEEKHELDPLCTKHGVTLISMIAPTSDERITKIASEATGFLYCVSSLGVTGVRREITTDVSRMVQKAKSVAQIPCAVGFGIATPAQARSMSNVSDGVIIGSAIVRIIASHGTACLPVVSRFVSDIRSALSNC